MRLQIETKEGIASSIEFNDNVIAQMVRFWTNVRHTSPQFPYELSPNAVQNSELYPSFIIPDVSLNEEIIFSVSPSHDSPITQVEIVQVVLHMLEKTDNIPTQTSWEKYFPKASNQLVVVPDGSAFFKGSGHQLILKGKSTSEEIATFAYEVLFSFKIGKDDTRYYGNIDPIVKITSSSGK